MVVGENRLGWLGGSRGLAARSLQTPTWPPSDGSCSHVAQNLPEIKRVSAAPTQANPVSYLVPRRPPPEAERCCAVPLAAAGVSVAAAQLHQLLHNDLLLGARLPDVLHDAAAAEDDSFTTSPVRSRLDLAQCWCVWRMPRDAWHPAHHGTGPSRPRTGREAGLAAGQPGPGRCFCWQS